MRPFPVLAAAVREEEEAVAGVAGLRREDIEVGGAGLDLDEEAAGVVSVGVVMTLVVVLVVVVGYGPVEVALWDEEGAFGIACGRVRGRDAFFSFSLCNSACM